MTRRRSFKIIDILEKKSFPKKGIWINEARFGFNYIYPYLERVEHSLNVLEVGCGSGILLSMLSEMHNKHHYDGLEPFGSGFSSLSDLNEFVKSQGIDIKNIRYEEFTPNKKYDLIFCINVFEHLDDWQHFLAKMDDWLSLDGVCVVLCPNYVFPYESHFKIPIILNKTLTHKIFKRHIKNFEKVHDCEGLWQSLNFVKLTQVKRYIKKRGLALKVNNRMVEDLVNRLSADREFLARQKFIGKIAVILNRYGLLKIFRLELFEVFQPYMMLEVRKKKSFARNRK